MNAWWVSLMGGIVVVLVAFCAGWAATSSEPAAFRAVGTFLIALGVAPAVLLAEDAYRAWTGR